MSNISQHTKLILTLAVQAAAIVWWASNLSSRVQHNNYQLLMLKKEVDAHAIFVRDWPVGKLGALPDDVRQNLFIETLQKQVKKLYDDLYDLDPTLKQQ
jgi:hypothetical protein